MNFYQEEIVDFILNGPRSSSDSCDEFDELVENYMETFSSGMDDDDADLAFGFSDWISDLFYESWFKRCSSTINSSKYTNPKNNIESFVPQNIPKPFFKGNFSKEEDTQILKFLIKHRKFSETKDIKLWEQMQEEKVTLRRTGRSMRERFNKRISPNISLKLLCAIYAELL